MRHTNLPGRWTAATLNERPRLAHGQIARTVHHVAHTHTMTILTLDLVLPAAPAALLKAKTRVVEPLTAPRSLPIDIASPRFFARADPTDEAAIAALFGDKTVDEFPAEESDDEDADEEFLLELDPKEWRKQDHYRVLGLSEQRYLATYDEIKAAHRKRVLKHHPDKMAAMGADNDAVFKCIQKAWDTLSDPEKRRQYDSCDKGVSDATPSEAELKALWEQGPDEHFYPAVEKIFKREARFSKKAKVPSIGNSTSARKDVEGFYKFWYDFDSFRSFEYEDKDDVDASSNRDHKRYLEGKNKSERARKKNEDNARLRSFIDRVLKVDVRMKQYKEDDKAAKKAKAAGRGATAAPGGAAAAAKKAADEAAAKKAAEEAAAKAAAEAEVAKKAAADADKVAKKELKDKVKKEKKAIKQIVVKDFTYLAEAPTAQVMEKTSIDVEVVLEGLKEDLPRLVALREALQAAAKSGLDAVKAAFYAELDRVSQQ
ncbi:Zuotin [Blastocladiella emersonii ATCC 22665]|nr:Zuotin [Blastocladiella emersonii ATCC 22665]